MRTLAALVGLWLCFTGCSRSPTPPLDSSPPPAPTNVVATPPLLPEPNQTALTEALALKASAKLTEARAVLQPLAGQPGASDKLLTLLGELNTRIAFTPVAAPEKVDHVIVAGDTLGKLAKHYGVTLELIKQSNGLSSDVIRIGNRLRIYRGQFAVVVAKSANTLTVTDAGNFFKRYRVGTGQYSKTPVGEFQLTSRVAQPPWYRADGKTIPYGDPENILGTHWLGLNAPGIGLHGTWDTNSIGRQASAGCVRLLNDDVAELHALLPLGTPVTIQD